MNQCLACGSPTDLAVCQVCEAEDWQTIPAELPPAPFPGPRFERWKARAASMVVVAFLLLPGVTVFAAVSPRALVAGSVQVAGQAAPEALTSEADLFAPTSTTTSTTSTLPPEILEDPGLPSTEDPDPAPEVVTTTTEAPAPTPPKPKPPKTTTTAAPSVPSVVGLDLGTATATLDAAGYSYSLAFRVAPQNLGIVLSQSGSGTVALTVGEATPEPPAEDLEPDPAP